MRSRVRYGDVAWSLLAIAMVLTAIGGAFVFSACWEHGDAWSRESAMQLVWWAIALGACGFCLHVPLTVWRSTAIPLLVCALLGQLFMLAMRGTPLVPRINGAHNWLSIGPLRLQPSEFIKLAVLLALARLLTMPGADARRVGWVAAACALVGVPMVLMAKEDLGSALTFAPMTAGVLLLAGTRLRILAGLGATGVAGIAAMIAMLPKEGPGAYMWRRILAWRDPEAFALTEGYQTIRALRSVGSGQITGKGYGLGDQNLLGWLPEQHTDMIFAVIAEETGFVGSFLLVTLIFLALGFAGLAAAARCRDPFARLFVGGFTCLLVGQAAINLAVVLGLMPVAGITLPFISYGGSSLLASYVGIGICLAATAAPKDHLGRTSF